MSFVIQNDIEIMILQSSKLDEFKWNIVLSYKNKFIHLLLIR